MSIKKSQDLSDFASWMEGTTPLEFPKTNPEFGKKTKQYQQARIHAQEERTLSPRMQDVLQENLSGIAPAIFQRLCAGKLRYQQTIDLHGMEVQAALNYLHDLFEKKRTTAQTWLIIYGKGKRSDLFDPSPLKWQTLQMLRQSAHVGALATLIDKDGKHGSVAVYLHPSRRFIHKIKQDSL